jgi:hypothetical protein
VPAVVGVPFNKGVVVELPDIPGVHGSPEVPAVVASRSPGAVSDPPFGSTVVRTSPGGIWPVTVHEPTFIVFVIVNPSGVIGTPTVVSKTGNVPFGLGVNVEASVVAPAIESTAPSDAAATAADLSRAPTGELSTKSSAVETTRSTGERWRRATSVAVDRLNQAQWRRMNAASFIFCVF